MFGANLWATLRKLKRSLLFGAKKNFLNDTTKKSFCKKNKKMKRVCIVMSCIQHQLKYGFNVYYMNSGHIALVLVFEEKDYKMFNFKL